MQERNDYEKRGKLGSASDHADHEAHYWNYFALQAATGTTTTTVAYDYDKRGASLTPRFEASALLRRPRTGAPLAPVQGVFECAFSALTCPGNSRVRFCARGEPLYRNVRFCAILYVGFKVMAVVDNRSHAGPSEPTHRTVST